MFTVFNDFYISAHKDNGYHAFFSNTMIMLGSTKNFNTAEEALENAKQKILAKDFTFEL